MIAGKIKPKTVDKRNKQAKKQLKTGSITPHKKKFLRMFSVNVTKSTVSCGADIIY